MQLEAKYIPPILGSLWAGFYPMAIVFPIRTIAWFPKKDVNLCIHVVTETPCSEDSLKATSASASRDYRIIGGPLFRVLFLAL